ncbi:MAG: MBL fold metallo-hydrolase [Firmicutes bacterium]|jgi:hypothetical protein ELI_2197|nr:MBL fold metallo-hydrolase [Bacillota bacterium]
MSYAKEKEKIRRKHRKIKYAVVTILMIAVAGVCIFSWFVPPSSWKYYVSLPDVSKRREGELRIHFLDVGQGDCTLLEFPDGQTMLIDGGDGQERNTAAVLRYLNALKIKRPDFLLLTHSDSDHCGGLAKILKMKGAGTIYLPAINNYYINDEYAAFREVILTEKYHSVDSRRYLQIVSNSAAYPYTLTFLWPYRAGNPGSPYDKVNGGEYTEDDLNDCSAVVWLDYFGTSALFCGDATSRVEKILMQDYEGDFFKGYGVELDNTEILKVSHHGSASGTSREFMEFLGVETAAISCGKNNPYGHPSAEACGALESVGAEIYRTDRQGNIVVTISSGGKYRTHAQYAA